MGRRVAGRTGRRSLDELVRLACSTDPAEPVERPRRAAVAPRAAIGAGLLLIMAAIVLALRTVLISPDPSPQAQDPPSAAPSAQATGPVVVDPAPGASVVPSTGTVVVHVAGAVAAPGVVTLPTGSRVADALAQAGGVTADADTDQLNLARVLTDGEQVRVPRHGEDVSAWATGAAGQAAQDAPQDVSSAPGGLVNINTATASELETLPGIGPALAARIVEHRQANGPFTSVEDLTDVPGIGSTRMEALREAVTL
ncbi:MAG: ComEA family DNA-binding protein [Actinomyces sp.]|uniref:ComEA family DNA-binding protein n=1 Tax=Actinomyces sp. TaxID=29317 RepID=UPI0026DABCFC|nr:ComEA family DNA-binding protein [Actinomyces sp.]MDO4242616.1 ComEA family DNA-binding protein [Actinomyces sp.]